jgi:hypothetical protein
MDEFKVELLAFAKYLVANKWHYVAFTMPIFVILFSFYIRNKNQIFSNAKGFIRWIKPSFETGNFANAEKLTAFGVLNCAYLPSRLYFAFQISDPIHLLYGSTLDAFFILVLYRIISPQNIIELKNGYKEPQEKKDEQN